MNNIIVLLSLSLSLVSLASAACSAEREIIAQQARKIQSQADEIKALKKFNLRRRLMQDGDIDESDDDDSAPAPAPVPAPSPSPPPSDESSVPAPVAWDEEWNGFVTDMYNLKAGDAHTASEEEEGLDLEVVSRVSTRPATLSEIDRCAQVSKSDLGRVPAFARFVESMRKKKEYKNEATLGCMICSLSRMYDVQMSDLIGKGHLDLNSAYLEDQTYNPLVVMAPNTWLNDNGCLALINPDPAYCNDIGKCSMKVPTFGELTQTAAENAIEARVMTKVYTAEAAMEYFELGLPVASFNFIMSRFFDLTDNKIVFDKQEWDALRDGLDLAKQAQDSGPLPVGRRRRLQTQIPNGLS